MSKAFCAGPVEEQIKPARRALHRCPAAAGMPQQRSGSYPYRWLIHTTRSPVSVRREAKRLCLACHPPCDPAQHGLARAARLRADRGSERSGLGRGWLCKNCFETLTISPILTDSFPAYCLPCAPTTAFTRVAQKSPEIGLMLLELV